MKARVWMMNWHHDTPITYNVYNTRSWPTVNPICIVLQTKKRSIFVKKLHHLGRHILEDPGGEDGGYAGLVSAGLDQAPKLSALSLCD